MNQTAQINGDTRSSAITSDMAMLLVPPSQRTCNASDPVPKEGHY
ncbi:hypothetical protein A2U01_0057295, partial [Trifolium medium]|nr:hypothetical protein [Trifolium medium]